MRYGKIVQARFLRRPNRFVAYVELEGRELLVHVKNTGRCRELLQPGAKVYLAASGNPARKTPYDLVTVEKLRPGKAPLLVNMDAQAPNEVAAEWLPKSGLFSPNAVFRREAKWRNSRFDFFIQDGGRKAFLEVKGVTLEYDGHASFPDAPTERGMKHLHELIDCQAEGYEAYVLFVVQMKEMLDFGPSVENHPDFATALRKAADANVKILAMDCVVTPDTVTIDAPVPVVLSR
ncbi:MAG: DNA/RNA nuclease SfsA [Victivallales bacterium]|nr:DNA/RNA nuclease SfsA [Victivallales bacterium]